MKILELICRVSLEKRINFQTILVHLRKALAVAIFLLDRMMPSLVLNQFHKQQLYDVKSEDLEGQLVEPLRPIHLLFVI